MKYKPVMSGMLQVHPQEYQADMTSILGFVLKHDDSVNDRTEVPSTLNCHLSLVTFKLLVTPHSCLPSTSLPD